MKKTLHPILFLLLSCSLTFYWACTPKTADNMKKTEEEFVSVSPSKEMPAPSSTDFGKNVPIPVDQDVRMGTLPNGLKYYIRKNQKPENRAELRLAVNAGSMQEDEDQQGLAHFVEHMAFNGSTNFKKNELVDYLESIGTKFGPDLNAYTSFDETVYMLQARTDEQEMILKGLTVIEDWAGGVSFDGEEIDKERGVVVSEWRTRLSPNQRMQQTYFPIMYQGSRYAERLPIGKPKIIETADYETVKRFYKDWYRPNLMSVVVVGDVDVDMMEKEIAKRFSKLKNPENARKREKYKVPRHPETLISVCSDKEASFTNVRIMYKHDHIKTKNMNDYRQSIVRRLYNGMLNARLDELAQSPTPPFLYAYTGYSSDVGDMDTYSSFAMVPEGGSAKGLEVLLEENSRVLKYGFGQGELERQKTEVLKRMEKAFKEKDKTDSRRFASRYVYNYLKEIPMPSIDEELEFYKELLPTINLDEINKLAKQWITDENRVIVLTGPEKEESPMPTEADVKNILSAVAGKNIMAYVDKTSDAPLLDKVLNPTAISKEMKMEEIGTTEINLANGVKIVLKPTDFKNDEIMLSASSPGGHSLYSDADYANATHAGSVINEAGLGEFDLIQLQKKLTGKTVNVSPFIGEMYEGMRGSSSPDDFETMLQLIYLYFTAPRKDADALMSYKNKQKSIYGNLLSNPQYYFMDQTFKIKSNNHPRRGFPTAEEFDKISLDRAYEIYQERFADASDFTFFFVGNFEVEKIKPMLSKYLGNLPSTKRVENWKDVNSDYPKGKVDKSFSKGEAPKTLVDMTFHGKFDWKPENRYVFNSMVKVLKIKMRESMREDKGGVYGVRVSGNTYQFPDSEYSINISFNCEPGKAQDLIQTAMADIATAKKIGAEEKDLTKVKETQKQERIKALKENRFWMNHLRSSYTNNSDPNKVTTKYLEEAIDKLTSDDIKKAANQYFDMNNFIKIVMVPEGETTAGPKKK